MKLPLNKFYNKVRYQVKYNTNHWTPPVILFESRAKDILADFMITKIRLLPLKGESYIIVSSTLKMKAIELTIK